MLGRQIWSHSLGRRSFVAKKRTTKKTRTAGMSTRSRRSGETKVGDYRHDSAKRKNNPPAKIAAEGTVPVIPKAEYAYSPRRPPELRFDPTGGADKLPELLEKARREPLTKEEADLLAEALRTHQPWLVKKHSPP